MQEMFTATYVVIESEMINVRGFPEASTRPREITYIFSARNEKEAIEKARKHTNHLPGAEKLFLGGLPELTKVEDGSGRKIYEDNSEFMICNGVAFRG